jgi:hypothetical protein
MPSQMALHNEVAINQQQKQTMKVLSTYKRLSLWLIPPEPILSSLSCTQKQLISLHMSEQQQKHNNKKAPLLLPTFIPHITLVGGVPISECCSMEDDVLPQLLSLQQQQEQEVNNPSNNEEDCDDNGNKLFTIDNIDELAAQSVLKRLQCAFSNFGGVSCNFVKERGVFAATRRRQRRATSTDESNIGDGILINGVRSGDTHKMNVDDDNKDNSNGEKDDKEGQIIEEVQWNQSCIAIMERSTEFINAMELADKALFSHRYKNNNSSSKDDHHDGQSSSLERHFKAPSCEPHYSFVYGNDASLIQSISQKSINSNNISDGSDERSSDRDPMILECPPNFTSTEIIVMWTYPSTLEGVEQWREIGRFSLVEESVLSIPSML